MQSHAVFGKRHEAFAARQEQRIAIVKLIDAALNLAMTETRHCFRVRRAVVYAVACCQQGKDSMGGDLFQSVKAEVVPRIAPDTNILPGVRVHVNE